MLHGIDTNQSTGSAEPSLAMDSDCAVFSLTYLQKLVDNRVRGRASINKEEVSVVDSVPNELLSLVFGFVQSDNMGYAEMLEHLEIILGSIASFRVARL